jgi:GDP-L-fucose synthase
MKTVLVTGANGLLGSAIKKNSVNYQYKFHFIGRTECDLTSQIQVQNLINEIKPNYVIHTAASVGGIGLNISKPINQFYKNLLMNSFLIHESALNGVEKFINFSSICAFPGNITSITEDLLHEGTPFQDHFSYAQAKRISDIQIEIYNKNFGLNYMSLIPTNIFGENDNYNLNFGHVIPSLIHKCYLAKKTNTPFIVWGDGTAIREFIYSDDLSKICLDILSIDTPPQKILTSNSIPLTINQVVNKICEIFDYNNLVWDTTKPNGQLIRKTNNNVLKSVLPNFNFTDFDIALENSVRWFIDNYPKIRL